jgi:hypothetical protein
MNASPDIPEGKKVFEPTTDDDLVRGWIIHAHKGRDRHDEAARKYEKYRYWLGVPTLVLSAIVGTSIFVSLQTNLNAQGKILLGLVSITSSVLAGLQTFLSFAERAEKHRIAGVKYKGLIRELEQFMADRQKRAESQNEWFTDMRKRMDTLELEAPVVSERIYRRVEKKYSRVDFVLKADQLYRQDS